MIEARNLTKHFGGKLAVDDVSFDVKPGIVTGFLGPNGAGKSTTMRLMLGLDKGRGSTLYGGKPLTSYVRPMREVGILLEAKSFHPTRTARNHLLMLAATADIPKTRVDEVLDLVGLHQAAKGKPGSFSLGMSQRLGLAAAILGEPKYLILDEPANGLDPEGTAWLRRFMKDYAAKGNAVLVSSHLLSEMSLMATNVVVIGRGKILADTSIDQLLKGGRPTATFVRTRSLKKLQSALEKQGWQVTAESGGLNVAGATTDEVGRVAHKLGAVVHELTARSATLEDVFLEMTADSQEYSTGKGGDK